MTDAASGRQAIIALVNPTAGMEDEFNDWYPNTHLPEVVALPGFISAQRYAVPDELLGQVPYSHATVYEIEGSALQAQATLFGAGLEMSPSFDVARMVFLPFSPVGTAIQG